MDQKLTFLITAFTLVFGLSIGCNHQENINKSNIIDSHNLLYRLVFESDLIIKASCYVRIVNEYHDEVTLASTIDSEPQYDTNYILFGKPLLKEKMIKLHFKNQPWKLGHKIWFYKIENNNINFVSINGKVSVANSKLNELIEVIKRIK